MLLPDSRLHGRPPPRRTGTCSGSGVDTTLRATEGALLVQSKLSRGPASLSRMGKGFLEPHGMGLAAYCALPGERTTEERVLAINIGRLTRSLRYTTAAAQSARRFRSFSRTSFRMLYDLRDQGQAAGTILDVGANKGQFSAAARSLFPEAVIHSFEPLPRAAEQLRRVSSGDARWFVHEVAVTARNETATLRVNAHSQSSSLLDVGARHLKAFPTATTVDEIAVSTATLDSLLASKDLARPVLLKIDTQGTEDQVILGAERTLARVDFVLVELSFVRLYEGDSTWSHVADLLARHDFRLDRPVGLLRDPASREILQFDGLFVRSSR